ncbi:hypothetical protein LSCM1_07470 [Leishmania martiniquensis]|uniref:Uncharacterized protein n=1 Tax=Leishmania martiniquensis TaxID=1580590 RepID=A0A836H800_9TRYP|nr:hypothetical protein LSCM1_07470 [Leishmania martiniquensis]
MGTNVSVLLEANAPVPSVVISSQHEVRARRDLDNGTGSAVSASQLRLLPSSSSVVERCPKIRVTAAGKAQETLGGSGSASVAREVRRTPPPLSAEEPPVLLVEDCAAPDAFTTSRTYTPVMNAIVAYVGAHGKAGTAAAGKGRGGSGSGKVMCPIGIDFDPTLCLGNLLSRGEARAACAEYFKLFFTHLIAALENVGKESQEEAPSTRTSTSTYSMGAAAAATAEAEAPQRFFLLYIDARSGQLDDAAGQWLATSLIMSAVRRTRPYALVSARTNAAGGSGSEDGFMSYFSPDVKADMVWASLQHILLTHNNMTLQGVKTVLEALLAEDAMHEVLLHQQGFDPKAQKAVEVMTAVMQSRVFPRQGSKLLPQLYLVDVRHNQYDDAEVAGLQKMALTSAGGKAELAAGQADLPVGDSLKQRLPASQSQRSDYSSVHLNSKLSDALSVGHAQDGHNSTARAAAAAAAALSGSDSSSHSLKFSMETPDPSTPHSPAIPEALQATVASLKAPPLSSSDARGGRARAPPVQAKPRTLSPLRVPRSGLRKVQAEDEKSCVERGSPRAPPESIRGSRLDRAGAVERAIDKAPDGLVMSRRAGRLRSTSPRSETRATASATIPPASATPRRTAVLDSPRWLSARDSAPSWTRVDAVELQRAYDVLRAQRPDSARKTSAAATSSHPPSPRQCMPSPMSQRQSSMTRARRRPELYREEDELDDAEMEVHSLTPHPRHHPHPRSQRSLRQCGPRSGHDPGSGRAEDEAWLDEVYTQSRGGGTSPALSIGSQRRCYDIPALAPPEPFFAASAAHVSPTIRDAGARKRHETPAQVASRRASPESARWRRKNLYDDVQPRVDSGRVRNVAEQRGVSRPSSRAGYPASTWQHHARPPSSSMQVDREVKAGVTSPLSEQQSYSPAPKWPAAVAGVVEKATPSLAVTDANAAPASAQTSSIHQSLHGGVSAALGRANDSQSSQYHRPATTVSMGNTVKRRLSTAEPPHITPRGTLTSQLRKITSQRQRRFSEVEENEDAYYARIRQPRRKFWMAHVTATMRAPWAQPLEMAAVLQEQKRCASIIAYHRGSAHSAPIMADDSLLRRGSTATQQEWDSPARSDSSDGSLVPMAARTHGPRNSADAAPTPEYNENGIELVHMKLRTRSRTAF